MTPKVSIVIPTYNSSSTIREALESVAAQTFTDYEVIVVDDASTDDTVEVVREAIPRIGVTTDRDKGVLNHEPASPPSSGAGGWTRIDTNEGALLLGMWPVFPVHSHREIPATASLMGKDSRIDSRDMKIIILEENVGPAGARNRGVAEARGEWIAFLDGDDVWLPQKLDEQIGLAAESADAVMWCGMTADYSDNAQLDSGSIMTGRDISLDELSECNPIATSTILVRRDVVKAVGGFDEQFRGPEDYDLWLRIAAKGVV